MVDGTEVEKLTKQTSKTTTTTQPIRKKKEQHTQRR